MAGGKCQGDLSLNSIEDLREPTDALNERGRQPSGTRKRYVSCSEVASSGEIPLSTESSIRAADEPLERCMHT